jgi:hypothetical protein
MQHRKLGHPIGWPIADLGRRPFGGEVHPNITSEPATRSLRVLHIQPMNGGGCNAQLCVLKQFIRGVERVA